MWRVKARAGLHLIGLALGLGLGLGFWLLVLGATAPLRTHNGDATGWNNAQKVVVDAQGGVHLVFQYALTPAQAEDLFVYAHLTPQGWEVAEQEGRWPTLAYDGSTSALWLAYVRRGAAGDQLWLMRIDTEERKLITESTPHSLFYPALVAHNGSVYLAWEAHRGGRSAIMLAVLHPVPDHAPVLERVAEGVGLYFPTLALGPDGHGLYPQLHLAYEEAPGGGMGHRIVHAWREDNSEGKWHHEVVSGGVPDARYPALDYDPERKVYELVFVGYSTAGNTIYYRYLDLDPDRGGQFREGKRSWSEPSALTAGLEPGYWTFPVVEDGLVVWGRTVAASCSVGPLYYCFPREGCTPQELGGEFAAFPHLFRSGRSGNTWHLVWTDRDPESPLWRVIRYLRLGFPGLDPVADARSPSPKDTSTSASTLAPAASAMSRTQIRFRS